MTSSRAADRESKFGMESVGPVYLAQHWAVSIPDLRWDIKFVCEKKKNFRSRGPSEQLGPGQLPSCPVLSSALLVS